jgi:nucleoside-diphosphate-sugar epimerase
MNVLITGATGFVGSALIKRLENDDCCIRALVRTGKPFVHLAAAIEQVAVQPLSDKTEFGHALDKIDVVVHLAARTHVIKESIADPLSEYRAINKAGTERLARQAAEAGVKRMVFLSSVKVNGEGRPEPYTEIDLPLPNDPYSISKREAEESLKKVEAETGLEVVVIRPPLVYGPGVKANFLRLMQIIERGFPLPLASVRNLRSLIYIGSLVDAISVCMVHPKSAGQTYLVSDGEDLSTPELIRRLSFAMGRSARLLPFPPTLMRLAGTILGKGAAVNRLLGTLSIDSTKIRRELGWQSPFTMKQGLAETAKWFRKDIMHSEL